MKFADCPCTAEEEDWRLSGRMDFLEDDEGQVMVEYQCVTCGERQASQMPLERV